MKANRRFAHDQEAVSDVVGSILLVAITVVLSAALGGLIFTVAKPVATVTAQVSASIEPGLNGWSSGDERITMTHIGGEAIDADSALVRISIDGVLQTPELQGATLLGSAFADGKLTIGEKWIRTQMIPTSSDVDVKLVVTGSNGGSQVLSTVATSTDCSGDALPPIVRVWDQLPGDLTTGSGTQVKITATLEDACQGVDPSVKPHLFYRFNTGLAPLAVFIDANEMSTPSLNVWEKTVTGLTFTDKANQVFEYYISPLTDLAAITGPSDTQSDPIDDTSATTWVSGNTAHVGSIDAPTSMGQEDGQFATLREAAQTVAPVTQASKRNATASSGVATANRAVAANESSNAYATLTANNYVEVSGFTVPAGATTFVGATIVVEGGKSQSGGASPNTPTAAVSYTATGCSASTTLTFSTVAGTSTDVAQPIPANACLTLSNLPSLAIRVTENSGFTRDVYVDQIYVLLYYKGAATTSYNMTIELRFPALPSGTTTATMQILYQAPSEAFQVLVWNGNVTNPLYTQRGANLFQTSLSTAWTYSLTTAELGTASIGPKIRIIDVDATNSVEHTLLIDYARIQSV
jgi:archaeal type IV pilus assembly protein PilA